MGMTIVSSPPEVVIWDPNLAMVKYIATLFTGTSSSGPIFFAIIHHPSVSVTTMSNKRWLVKPKMTWLPINCLICFMFIGYFAIFVGVRHICGSSSGILLGSYGLSSEVNPQWQRRSWRRSSTKYNGFCYDTEKWQMCFFWMCCAKKTICAMINTWCLGPWSSNNITEILPIDISWTLPPCFWTPYEVIETPIKVIKMIHGFRTIQNGKPASTAGCCRRKRLGGWTSPTVQDVMSWLFRDHSMVFVIQWWFNGYLVVVEGVFTGYLMFFWFIHVYIMFRARLYAFLAHNHVWIMVSLALQ